MYKTIIFLLLPVLLFAETQNVGSGQTYTNLTDWEAWADGFTTRNDTAYLVDAAEYDEADLTFNGKTTGRWTILTSGNGVHDGTPGSGAYITNTGSGHVVLVQDTAFTIDGVEIKLETANANSSDEGIRCDPQNVNSRIIIRNCIIWMDTNGTNDCDGVYIYRAGTIYVENCIILNFARAGIHLQNHTGTENINVYAFNCTVDNCGETGEGESGAYSWFRTGGTQVFETTNCVGTRTGDADADNWESDNAPAFTGTNNATDEDDALDETKMPSTGAVYAITPADEFETLGDDYHTNADGDLYGAGIGPGSDADVPTDDIDGDTRSGSTCEIGADEYVAPPDPPEVSTRRRYVN